MKKDDLTIEQYIKVKERRKIFRTIIESLICILVVGYAFSQICFSEKYKAPNKELWSQQNGFVMISYASIGNGDDNISEKELDEQLGVLYDNGYTTIGVDDVVDFYDHNGKLPDKALFLVLEDGTKASTKIAKNVLKKYNYKAITMNYAGYLTTRNRSYLNVSDLKKIQKDDYFDIGTSGYRFEYINVKSKDNDANSTDNDANSTDIKNSTYDHYLADYLRDGDDIPIETQDEMTKRINWDYEEMNKIYKKILGDMPKCYMMVPADKLFYNITDSVGKVNEKNINKYFDIAINRTGDCYNTRNQSKYDLTRIKVEKQWSGSQLLDKINKSINKH